MEAYGKLQRLTPAAQMDGNADSMQGQGARQFAQSGAVPASELASDAFQRHELAGARTQAKADIAELHGASPAPTPEFIPAPSNTEGNATMAEDGGAAHQVRRKPVRCER